MTRWACLQARLLVRPHQERVDWSRNWEVGFTDWLVEASPFNFPDSVAPVANDVAVVADTNNHAIRVITPGGRDAGCVDTIVPVPFFYCCLFALQPAGETHSAGR